MADRGDPCLPALAVASEAVTVSVVPTQCNGETARVGTGGSPGKTLRAEGPPWPTTPPRPRSQPSAAAATPIQNQNHPAAFINHGAGSSSMIWMADTASPPECAASAEAPAQPDECPETPTSPSGSLSLPAPSPSSCREVVFDLDDDAFSSDYFRMYEFKVKRCPRARPHDWTLCPFAHPGEKAKRRDPRHSRYSGSACPDFRKGYCKRGDTCHFAHGVFECWLHPSRYRTQMCTDGIDCKRRVCFFAHREEEIRTPEEDPEMLEAELAADAQRQHMQQAQQQKQQQDMATALSTLMNAQLNGMQPNPYLEVIKTLTGAMPANAAGADQMATLMGAHPQVQMPQAPAGGSHSQQMNQLQWLQQHQAVVAAAEMQLRLAMQQQQLQHPHQSQMMAQQLHTQQLGDAHSVGCVPSHLPGMMANSGPPGSPQHPDVPPGLGLRGSPQRLSDQQQLSQQGPSMGVTSPGKQGLTPIFESRHQACPTQYSVQSTCPNQPFSSQEVGIGLGGLDLNSGIWSRRSEPGMADTELDGHQRRDGLRYHMNPDRLGAGGMRRTWAGGPEGELFNAFSSPPMRASETYETQRFGSTMPGGGPSLVRSTSDIGYSMNSLSIASPPYSPETASRTRSVTNGSPPLSSAQMMGLNFLGMEDEWACPPSSHAQQPNIGW